MRIAYFGPLRPSCGAAVEIGERLLPRLARDAEVTVLADGMAPASAAIAERCRVYDLREVHYRKLLWRFDLVVYAVAQGEEPEQLHEALCEWPGVVLAHGDLEPLFALHPRLRRAVLERSLAVVVDSPPAARRLRAGGGSTPVFVVEPPTGEGDEAARRLLEIFAEVLPRRERWLSPLLEAACAEMPGFLPAERSAPWRAEVDELVGLPARPAARA